MENTESNTPSTLNLSEGHPASANPEGTSGAVEPFRSPEQKDIASLALELGRAYKRTVDYYREREGLSAAEADEKARQPFKSLTLWNVAEENVTWWRLSTEVGKNPEEAYDFWRRIKQLAADEFESGHRAASSMAYNDTPWQRAQFLAVRDALVAEWEPHGASELMLIDSMTQAYSAQLFWMEELHRRSTVEVKNESQPRWLPPRVTVAEAIDQAAAMVDRFNKIYVRALRGLRDLRRHAQSIRINGAGQVNIGHQQVIQQSPSKAHPKSTESSKDCNRIQLNRAVTESTP